MSIAAQLNRLKAELLPRVKLVAVSKYFPESAIQEAYDAGQRIFGESRAQEIVPKYEHLPKDIQWHFIGHLQANKVKYIAPFIDTIHSVDSLKLLLEINAQAAKNNRLIKVLLEVHIAQEEQKNGFAPDELVDFLAKVVKCHGIAGQASNDGTVLPNVEIVGLMGMATYTENELQIRREFTTLAGLFSKIKQLFFANQDSFCELSMGMSNDYPLAIAVGSTMVRIGSKIFGDCGSSPQ
ncbi:MAG: YggS family pyridoxal phosphate-dependent enzyme [Candidatus Symbiothrix sp.]|jgi:pyridoxal phosphate enzyme (YggS family)|nr:YggS family pyridoxal phosphate-dependent enzyme [Candidatus Symbiothrix sp.]